MRLRILTTVLALFAASVGVVVVAPPAGATMISSGVSHPSDCSGQDVTRQVVDFADGGGAKELQPGGCYIVNEKLIINGSLDGNGAEIRKTSQKNLSRLDNSNCDPGHQGLVKMSGGATLTDITLHRLGTTHYNECHYSEHGIEDIGGANVTIRDVIVDGAWGDCLYIQGTGNLGTSIPGVTATNLNCLHNGRQGGAIAKGNNIHLDGFYVRDSDRSGFDFESNSASVESTISNVEIENFEITTDDDKLGIPEGLPDTLGPTETGKIAFPSQGYASPQNNIYIHNGTVHQALSGIYDRSKSPNKAAGIGNCDPGTRKNWRVENVVFEGMNTQESPGYGMRTTDRTPATSTSFGSPRAQAIFCGTQNVSFKNNKMPGGYLTFEVNTGDLVVSGNCYAGFTKVGQTTPVVESNNQVGGTCGSGPPEDTVPSAPTIGTATAGDTTATVRFSPPATNGGQPITNYKVTSSPGGLTKNGTGSPITMTGLTNGVTYTFTVKATNSIGTGPASLASNAVTPSSTVVPPDAPIVGTATAGDRQATVRWTPPDENGGGAINAYVVYSGTGTGTPVAYTTGSNLSVVATNLTNGVPYRFTVRAQNSAGLGASSALSNEVTPFSNSTVFQQFVDELTGLVSDSFDSSFPEFLASLQDLVDTYQ